MIHHLVDSERCDGCGQCVEICNLSLWEVVERKAEEQQPVQLMKLPGVVIFVSSVRTFARRMPSLYSQRKMMCWEESSDKAHY